MNKKDLNLQYMFLSFSGFSAKDLVKQQFLFQYNSQHEPVSSHGVQFKNSLKNEGDD